MHNPLSRLGQPLGASVNRNSGKNGNDSHTGLGAADQAPIAVLGGLDPGEPRSNGIVYNARREFASAFGDLAKGKRNWQVIAFVLGGALILQALSVVRLATTARAIPYVVQVDRLGTIANVGPAEALREPDARLIASQLAVANQIITLANSKRELIGAAVVGLALGRPAAAILNPSSFIKEK
jgi:hypothetical protein